MLVTPLFDRILVQPIADEPTTKSGLLIPDIARQSAVFGYGEVVGVGNGRWSADGELMKVRLKVGDTVMFPRKVGLVVPIPMVQPDGVVTDTDFLLFREPDILAKVSGLEKQSSIIDASGARLLGMTPFSRARPDVGYANTEAVERATRAGFIEPSDGYVDETEGLP